MLDKEGLDMIIVFVKLFGVPSNSIQISFYPIQGCLNGEIIFPIKKGRTMKSNYL
jgi:hypothetical protein